MSACRTIKEMILEILKDGEIHQVDEFKNEAIKRGYDLGKNDHAISNALYYSQKNNIIKRVGKGQYILILDNDTADDSDINNEECEAEKSHFKEDLSNDKLDEAIAVIINEVNVVKAINFRKDPMPIVKIGREKVAKLEKIKKMIPEF